MRSDPRQQVALALALLFGASLVTNAFGLHPCPHHGRSGGPASPSGGELARGTASRDLRVGMPGPASGRSGARCTCLGACHAGSATPLAAVDRLPLPGERLVRARPQRTPAHRPARTPPAYFLPFPHGPPVSG